MKKKRDYWIFFAYFVIYSFVGCVLETSFGFITKGVVESRQSFLFGPFCVIYGIGAILITMVWKTLDSIWNLKDKKGKIVLLLVLSILIGSVTEFLMSYFCEKIFHFKWWDYSGMKGNIEGRICLYFSGMWGILGIILIEFANPFLDKSLELLKIYVNKKILKIGICFTIVFLIFDAGISYIGLKSFYTKIVNDFKVEEQEKTMVYVKNKIFEEDNMLLIYPNIQIAGTKYNNVYVDSLYKNKKRYYFKVF